MVIVNNKSYLLWLVTLGFLTEILVVGVSSFLDPDGLNNWRTIPSSIFLLQLPAILLLANGMEWTMQICLPVACLLRDYYDVLTVAIMTVSWGIVWFFLHQMYSVLKGLDE